MHVTRPYGGFSLIEAVVAVALLALTCVTVSSVVALCLRAEARDARSRDLAVFLDRECATLQALPFYRPAQGPADGPTSLLARVFPHACPSLNTAQAAYQDGSAADAPDATAGDFVTLSEVSGVQMRCTARFVCAVGDDVVPVAAADERDWTVWSFEPPPSATLRVSLEATSGSAHATRRLLIFGVRPSIAGGSPTPAGGVSGA